MPVVLPTLSHSATTRRDSQRWTLPTPRILAPAPMDRLSDMRGTVNEGTPLQEEDPKSATLFKLVADIKASLAEMERMVKGQGCEDKSLKELFKELPTAYDDGSACAPGA